MEGLDQPQAKAEEPEPFDVKPEFVIGTARTSRVESKPVAPGGETAHVVSGQDPYLGRQFGGYELVQKVGQGGMGLVYKGRQLSLDRVVAVKILNKALCDNDEFIKRFAREAKSIARINHPNIMSVHDFGQTDGVWYMVIEFIEGSSLSRQIADRLMLPVEDLAPLLIQCLAGLAHVGAQGIVHRDIKPDNILITSEGIAKIADFGLAKDVSANNDATDLTAVGLAMGTPAYMSPEQCMGRKLDGRSDLYSLGVTAYLALTGEKPFTGQSSFEVMTKQREQLPVPPSKLNPHIPREVSELVMRMLAKSPSDRFSDAEACRVAWVDLGARLGFLGSPPAAVEVPSAPIAKNGRSGVHAPMPPAAPPLAPIPSMPPAPAEPVKATSPRRSTDMHPTAEDPGRGPSSERRERSTTERRLSARGAAVTGEAATCARCGMLNRGDAAVCSRCGHELRPAADDPQAARGQEVEAQRLFTAGQFKEAATIYARLADRETDRRARTVLRSREREARTGEHEQAVLELQNRTQAVVKRGELKAGIEILEKGLREVREAGSSSTGAETRLLEDITNLRTRLRNRRRTRLILAVVVAVLLLIGLVLFKLARPAGAAPGHALHLPPAAAVRA
jgi:serine/threonine protein kinase